MTYKSDHKWAYKPDDVPEGEHYAIIEFGSIYIPGDERSRTNPGHGYPGGSQPKVDYIVFESKEAWEKEIQRRVENKFGSPYRWAPVVARKAKLKTTIVVDVETDQ